MAGSRVPGFAQSHTVPVRDARNTALVAADTTTIPAVRVYEPAAAGTPALVAIPDNLDVTATHRPILDTMLQRSPTFRRQAQRIAAAGRLTVIIRYVPGHVSPRARARTRLVTLPDGRLQALVELLTLRDPAELIAHEIEHVIEQLDGVDLRTRSSQHATGVRQCEDGAFETLRAVRTGAAVAAEVLVHGG